MTFLALAAQFAYAIASSQAPKGPLEYKLHGELCPNAVAARIVTLHTKCSDGLQKHQL